MYQFPSTKEISAKSHQTSPIKAPLIGLVTLPTNNPLTDRRGILQIIGNTMEWKRIQSIPKRKNYASSELDILVINWSRLLSTDPYAKLTHEQALLLQELATENGAIGSMGVGSGKSFVAPLLPFSINAEKPLLIVPAQLKVQTEKSVLPKHKSMGYRIHPNLKIETYHFISSIEGAKYLETYQPDMIIFDECHKLKNPKSARTKRVLRYFKNNPQAVFVGLSGTITKDSLLDYYHLFYLALRQKSPLPHNYQEIDLWDKVLSPKAENEYYEKVHPGVLYDLDPIDPRIGYQKLLRATPGIIFTQKTPCDASINIYCLTQKYETPQLRNLREKWETPDGELICDALAYYQKARQVSNGFFYTYIEQPPIEWIEKKRAWQKIARHILRYNKRGIDTLAQLEMVSACIQEFVAWKEIENTYKPQIIVKWFDFHIMNSVFTYINSLPDKRFLIWCDSIAIGELFGQKYKYFGLGDSQKLLDYVTRSEIPNVPICLSIQSNMEGKNLEKFNKNIILTPPNSGKTVEQIIGRTHRQGQKADETLFIFCCHTDELEKSFDNAIIEARYIEKTTGESQKLLKATIIKS